MQDASTVRFHLKRTAYFPQLDTLRGMAAFVVVLHHAYLALPRSDALVQAIALTPALNILTLGRPAVVLFFVLSGFVLTASLGRDGVDWSAFALRRLIRLLIPFWTALAVSALLYALVPRHDAPSMSAWFNAQ